MRKLIAVLMAMLMTFSCAFALAEEPAAEIPAIDIPNMTITEYLEVNEEAILNLIAASGESEETLSMYKMFLPLLNGLAETVILADNGLQCDIQLKGQEILSLVAEATENGFALATDLIPSYVLTVDAATIQELAGQFMGQVQESTGAGKIEIDMELVQKAAESATGYVMELAEVFQNAVEFDEPEKGEYDDLIEGVVFNTEIPLSVDVEAMLDAIKTFLDQLAADENVKAAVDSITAMIPGAEDFDLSEIKLDDIPEEYIPEVSGVVYTITDDEGNQTATDTYVIVSAVGEEDDSGNVNTYVYVSDSAVHVAVDIPAQEMSFECHVEEMEGGFIVDYAIAAPGIDAEIAVAVVMDEAGIAADVAVCLNSEEPILTLSLTFKEGGERTKTAVDAEKAVLALETLKDEEKAAETIGALMMDAMNGIGKIFENVKTVLPEEGTMIEQMVNSLFSLFMGGGAMEEAPAEGVPAA